MDELPNHNWARPEARAPQSERSDYTKSELLMKLTVAHSETSLHSQRPSPTCDIL